MNLCVGMQELLFETYQAPSVCFGLDALFAGYANKIREDGLVVSAGRNTTVIVPVVGGRGVLDNAKRLSWGGALGSEFLHRLLQLKYPNLPQRITPFESQTMLDNLCYVSSDYDEEIRSLSQPDNLAKIDQVVQLPYVPPERPVKTQEELDKIAERKKAASQRLIEQTRMMRHEKAEQNENDLRYYTQVKEWKPKESTEAYLQRLEDEGFESEQEFEKTLKRLEAAVKRSRGEEEDAEEEKQPPTFPLVDVPDADLDEEGIKEKRRQRLMKAGYEARQRARAEKAEEDRLQAEAEARELQERQEHPEQWLNKLRKQHQDALARLQEQIRVREMLPDRKSAAAQQRMKNITALASDSKPTSQSGQRRKRGDDEDTFGADDSDWAVYRDMADVGEEQEQETLEKLQSLEAKLLEHDTQFTSEDTYAAMQARKTLLVTTFLRGYEPKWDPQDSALYHQVHLNVERIRVPEVSWQPMIAGVDQAGVSELAGHVLRSFEMPTRLKMISNVLVTGRYSALPNFDTRLASELQAILPPKSPLNVRRASNPRFDAWRGMQQWVSDQKDAFTASSVSLSEYQEYGAGWSKDYRFSACWQA
ncbi:Nuclear actin-protein involved in chromatin remodeling [Malassezia psittaci]|uniref:Nuclear actin-protein involved in chromatin remodeling n=1 Tax=Malassezia psittaci TaxID=1821823 RepID=A0AAF0FE37_9BASI|nr:Nuclear actin-protein involved in chromatin remodeling [Malassezia psittaci]